MFKHEGKQHSGTPTDTLRVVCMFSIGSRIVRRKESQQKKCANILCFLELSS